MAHDHAHHHHSDSETRLLWALLLTGTFMVAEVVGGLLAGSLALLADAAHMLTDSAALALAWFAARLSRRPSDSRRTFGYHRVQILAAFVNGLTLIGLVIWICVEAIGRLLNPVAIQADTLMVIATLGLVVNIVVFAILHLGDRENLNIRGAALHVLGDLLGSVAAIVAGAVIFATGWMPIDPLLSLLIAALILRSAWKLTRESAHILLEGAPDGLDVAQIEYCIPQQIDAVSEVHHVHAWSLTPARPMVSLHATLADGMDRHEAMVAIKALLDERFGISHATIQLEARDYCLDASAPDSCTESGATATETHAHAHRHSHSHG
ncbi:cobalt-zinc-cadmium efflux system protein [Onishia taeanensis]|jgi:cobalt-zinc-cadmium efflux system protein|uniref:Cobalt-zinc-cadmium efflux system protein n=1 Tax=Onishia taeanensis TaxID=284577 RepID=A0A1G7UML2_9GAMM|nr:cation diffusion facilitator family transporter [Halomonas taeanensis]SDG48598.1 cobalt-zinc-cadmium efflux system protein [Halomonas taeanensis]